MIIIINSATIISWYLKISLHIPYMYTLDEGEPCTICLKTI